MRNRGLRAGLLPAASFIAWASAAGAGETILYSYDSLGRLVRVERSGTATNAADANYSYDPADNRTNVTVTVAGAPAAAPPPPVNRAAVADIGAQPNCSLESSVGAGYSIADDPAGTTAAGGDCIEAPLPTDGTDLPADRDPG